MKLFTLNLHFVFTFLIVPCISAKAQQHLLYNAHSHNDYKHKSPLFDALENGFFSIEADIFYENGMFIVAHTKAGIRSKNKLEKIYLQPLKERVIANNGTIYSESSAEVELMLDLKGDWDREKLDSLSRLISNYNELFTVFENNTRTIRGVRILLSGNKAKYLAAAQNPRFFSIDGSLNDIDSPLDSNTITRTSGSFRGIFKWRGIGRFSEMEKTKLRNYILRAHSSGRKIRFWAAANRKKVWLELLDAGVDWINVDKIQKFSRFSAQRIQNNIR